MSAPTNCFMQGSPVAFPPEGQAVGEHDVAEDSMTELETSDSEIPAMTLDRVRHFQGLFEQALAVRVRLPAVKRDIFAELPSAVQAWTHRQDCIPLAWMTVALAAIRRLEGAAPVDVQGEAFVQRASSFEKEWIYLHRVPYHQAMVSLTREPRGPWDVQPLQYVRLEEHDRLQEVNVDGEEADGGSPKSF